MADFLKDWGPLLSWLISSGALIGAIKSVVDALKKRRQGVAISERTRRKDVLEQRDAFEAEYHRWKTYAYDLRTYAQAHGILSADLPPVPDENAKEA